MAKLTKEQQEFLDHHEVPLSQVFDASWMGLPAYKAAMKEVGALVAIGVAPCKAEYHTMRTRSGHCVQCNPASLGFLRRHIAPGTVYVAYSPRQGLVKVGSAELASARVEELNRRGYGSIWDWELTNRTPCAQAGLIESRAQRLLRRYWCPRTYEWAGRETDCYEIFSCTPETAQDAIDEAVLRFGD